MQKDALEPVALMQYSTFELAATSLALALEDQPPWRDQCGSQKQLGQGQPEKDPLPFPLGQKVGRVR